VIEINLAGAVVRVVSGLDDAQLTAVLRAVPLCHRSCRPDRIGTFGGAGRRTWLDTDSDIRIG